jgi:anaerobic selenocysteine-containing dehydrogenase
VLSIRGDAADPFSKGHICPKATALQTLYEDPDRLRQPLRKVNGAWEPMSWSAALDFAAEGLHAVQQKHGRNAVGLYLGNPTVHNTGALLFASLFARALRTKHRYSATSVDQLPHMLTAYWMFGHQLLLPVPDVDRTAYFLILGANPVASNGSLMTAPDMRRRLDEVKGRGGKVVVIDPRRTETAERASEHHFIRPGTDAWFLLGLLHEFVVKGAPQLRHLRDSVEGLSEVEALARRFPHVVLMRTFSKAWGLAGLRLGYVLASDEVARQLRKLVPPFAVSVMQTVAAEVALAHPGFMRASVARTIAERDRVAAALRAHPTWQVFPSSANFLLIRTPDAAQAWRTLLAGGVLVRRQDAQPGLEGCLRVTIGTPAENDAFLRAAGVAVG